MATTITMAILTHPIHALLLATILVHGLRTAAAAVRRSSKVERKSRPPAGRPDGAPGRGLRPGERRTPRLGVGRGWRCLEVGAGDGSDLNPRFLEGHGIGTWGRRPKTSP